MSDATVFDRVGGTEFFQRLAAAFYASVRTDPVLLALYPQPDDLDGAAQRLALFLMQYWGGPTTYSDERGHPRLRMRHAAYPIDEAMRDRWLSHMNAALDVCARLAGQSGADRLSAEVLQEMRDYFVRASDHLRNV
ncbi:MAG: globin [Actinomycetota bacterium]